MSGLTLTETLSFQLLHYLNPAFVAFSKIFHNFVINFLLKSHVFDYMRANVMIKFHCLPTNRITPIVRFSVYEGYSNETWLQRCERIQLDAGDHMTVHNTPAVDQVLSKKMVQDSKWVYHVIIKYQNSRCRICPNRTNELSFCFLVPRVDAGI